MIEIIFSSFAGGTFIYIAASEVIVEEFSVLGHNKWYKLLSFLLGALIITAMWLIEMWLYHNKYFKLTTINIFKIIEFMNNTN